MDKKLESMALMKATKKIVYTGGSNYLHAKHNKPMALITLLGYINENFETYKRFATNMWPYLKFVPN